MGFIRRALFGALCGALATAVGPSWAQQILPNALTQFVDGNGTPLAAGQACFYVPGTLTAKATFQDPALTIANASPCVTLDANGRGQIWGSGTYRQIVKDVFGTTVWDQPSAGFNNTSFAGGAATTTGSAPAYVLALPGLTAYSQGLGISFKASFDSIGSDTLNVQGLGAKGLFKPTAAGPAAIAPGDIKNTQVVFAEFDQALAGGAGGWSALGGLVLTGGTVTNVSAATNGGLGVTSPTTTPVLTITPANGLVKGVPTLADSALIMDAGASNAFKTSPISGVLAAAQAALFAERATSGTNGAALTGGVYNDVTMTATIFNNSGITASGPNLTVPAGSYYTEFNAVACNTGGDTGTLFQTRIFNVTLGSVLIDGFGNAVEGNSARPNGASIGETYFTLATNSQLKLQRYVDATSHGGCAVSAPGITEQYSFWRIIKLS